MMDDPVDVFGYLDVALDVEFDGESWSVIGELDSGDRYAIRSSTLREPIDPNLPWDDWISQNAYDDADLIAAILGAADAAKA